MNILILVLTVGVPAPDLGSPSARVKYSELERRIAQHRTDDGADPVEDPDLKRSFSNPLFGNAEIFLRVSNLKPASSLASPEPASQKKR